jgi:membrane protease subunit (stomatin/prohibitin family)
MASIEVIEFQGDNKSFVWKYPTENFTFGSQVIVHQTQEAIFFMNGQALDSFGPGRHTLVTENLPKLNSFFNFKTKETPFKSELYFVNLTEQMAIKWGTDSRVQFLEPKYKFPLTLGASGEMSLKVIDARKLLLKLVGTERFLSQEAVVKFLRSILMTKIKTYIASTIREGSISIFELDEYLESFSLDLKGKMQVDFESYGLELVTFQVTTLAKPDGEKEYERFKDLFFRQYADIAEAKLSQEVAMIQASTQAKRVIIESEAIAKKRENEGYSYHNERSFDVAEKVADNENSGGIANLGVGLGLMAGVVGTVVQTTKDALHNTPSQPLLCSGCGHSLKVGAKFCEECGQPAQGKQGVSCTKCGQHYDTPVKFCAQCGTKVG